MKKEQKQDQFFTFLLDQIKDPKEKLVLQLVEKYRSRHETRELIKEAIKELKKIE